MKKSACGIKAVIFDMDGLMFDTERIAAVGWRYAGEKLGFEITEQELCQLRGLNVIAGRKLFHTWYGDRVTYDEGRSLRAAYVKQYIEKHGTPVKDGLEDLFAYLTSHGYQKAIATSSSRETAERYFQSAGLAFDFEQSVCVAVSKPAPDIFRKAAEKLNLKPEQCLVLEDSYNGVRAGAAAGCQVVMIPDIQEPDEEIRKLCRKVCRNLREVIPVLENRSKNDQNDVLEGSEGNINFREKRD